MKKTVIILGFIIAIVAIAFAILPLYKIAFIPAVLALILGFIGLSKSKKENTSKTASQLILLLSIIALALASFKTLTSTSEVGDTQKLEQRAENSLEDSIDELNDIEITD